MTIALRLSSAATTLGVEALSLLAVGGTGGVRLLFSCACAAVSRCVSGSCHYCEASSQGNGWTGLASSPSSADRMSNAECAFTKGTTYLTLSQCPQHVTVCVSLLPIEPWRPHSPPDT